jgi:hypothetical protein
MGRIKIVSPSTKAIFAILEPITLPMAIPVLPCSAAFKLTKSSGAEVPKETTVIPIKNGETFSFEAKAAELLTSKSPPTKRKTIPRRRNTTTIDYTKCDALKI